MRGRKGYYFIIDAFIGSLIIFVSLIIILNSKLNMPKVQDNYGVAEDYSTFIINTKLEDIHSMYITNLITRNITPNTKYTIMDQVTEFYYLERQCGSNQSCIDRYHGNASGLVQNITDSLLSEKYGFSYTVIENNTTRTVIYSRDTEYMNASQVIIASRKISFLETNATTIIGPLITEIKIWI